MVNEYFRYNINEGWVPFGWHVAYLDKGFDVPLEFSPLVDETGLPEYERLRDVWNQTEPIERKLL